jgi:16S rRNA (adenine(1408)-N(1))-methyltransferase
MTINFPWGSLLRGVLGHDDAALAGVAALLAPGATARTLVSVIARDGVPGLRDDAAAVYARHGLSLAAPRVATAEEITASGSSWAKRLRAGTAARPVTTLAAARRADSPW